MYSNDMQYATHSETLFIIIELRLEKVSSMWIIAWLLCGLKLNNYQWSNKILLLMNHAYTGQMDHVCVIKCCNYTALCCSDTMSPPRKRQ